MPIKRRDLCWFYRIVAAMDFLVWQWKCLVAKFVCGIWLKSSSLSLSTERNPAIRVPRNLMWKFPSKWSTTERLRINCKLSRDDMLRRVPGSPHVTQSPQKIPKRCQHIRCARCRLLPFALFPPGPPTDKMGERLWTVGEIERNICFLFFKKKAKF